MGVPRLCWAVFAPPQDAIENCSSDKEHKGRNIVERDVLCRSPKAKCQSKNEPNVPETQRIQNAQSFRNVGLIGGMPRYV